MVKCRGKVVVGIVLLIFMAVSLLSRAYGETDYELILEWGSYGTGDGEFRFPNGICVDNQGYVYVADGGYEPPMICNHRIQKFLTNGTFVTKWGSQGTGNGQFQNRIQGIATDNQYVYVADQDNHRVQKFTLNGSFVSTWGDYGYNPGQFMSPYGITIDAHNNIYITDSDYWLSRIQKFRSDETFVANWYCGGSPRSIAYYEGYLYVCPHFGHVVRVYDTLGSFITEWGGYGYGDGQFRYPSGIACDEFGYLYVCDQHNARIQKLTRDGVFIAKWNSYGWFIAVDVDGYVYCSEGGAHKIGKYGILPIDAIVVLDPDVLNLESQGEWVTCYVELPDGYSVDDIELASVALRAVDNEPVEPPIYGEGPTAIGDYNYNGIPDLMVKFDRQNLIDVLEGLVVPPADAELTVIGDLLDNTQFEGSDIVQIISPGGGPQSFNEGDIPSRVIQHGAKPNPFNSSTAISYALPSDVQVQLCVYDLKGCLVKKIVDGNMSAGYHTVQWDGCNDEGEGLPNGVYLVYLNAGGHGEIQKLLLIR
jgi:DNA-binding beta-propeller fold protein YncE